ncbi:O-methyltransferase [Roseovarius tibetensis]|uniref:O-methyltransferase n=1 Tax=Roseovarius tibetensis TaxID=2685897 RepID=UPI003D7F57C6
MAPSYRSIDYRIRPSKHVERVMLCEAFRRLRFHVLEDYKYVGLGSVFFADFRMIHRSLGITRMLSIEKQENESARFEWNKPYSGIEMLFGETEQRLSDIDFSEPTIIWLDYDGPLTRSVISDIRHVAHAASHGSVLVATVNSHPRQTDANGTDMLEQVRGELGNERIPASADLSSLRGAGLSQFYRRVGDSEIRDALSTANGVRSGAKRLNYEQLFNFQYNDGAKMVTFGGVFFEREKRAEYEACAFDRLMFLRQGTEAYRIQAPKLTLREIAHLERQLPLPEGSELDLGPMPSSDAQRYIELYRFLPTFVPVDLM